MSFSSMIIKLSDVSPEWLELFGEESILELKICNQPLVEYYFHLARHLGVDKVILCHPFFKESIWKYEKIGHHFGINIFCETSPTGESLDFFKKRNKNLVSTGRSIVVMDSVFAFFDLKNDHIKKNLLRYNEDIIIGGEAHRFFAIKKLDSLKSYFDLSKIILERYSDNYFFKEFCVSQNGVYLGKYTKIKNLASVRETSIIGAGALISSKAICKSTCVISDYSQIGMGCELEGVILYNTLQLKDNISLKDKIILSDRIIDPISGEISYLKNKNKVSVIAPPLSNRLASFFLMIVLSPIVAFVEALLFSFKKENKDTLGDGEVQRTIVSENQNIIKVFSLFNWGVVNNLWRVIQGETFLFDSENLEKTKGEYMFSFSDFMFDRDFKIGVDIFSKYYNFRRSTSYDIIIILRFYLSNLMQVIR